MPVRTPTNTQLSSSYALMPSSIETIDYALYNFINDELNVNVTTNKGFEKIPVIFSNILQNSELFKFINILYHPIGIFSFLL